MLKEFKDFIAKGNVMDMAVGIIMGAAFTAIVNSMVGDLIMPIVGMFVNNLKKAAEKEAEEAVAAAAPPADITLLTEIRDALQKK